jgi:periplasmic protein TonB
MFEDSLMESGGRIHTNQKWTTPLSFLVQFLLIGFLVLLPLIITEGLPTRMLMAAIVAPPPPPPPPPPPAVEIKRVPRVSEIVNGELRTPSKIPKKIQMIKEDEAPPPVSSGVMGGVVGGVPGGTAGGVLNSLVGSAAPPPKQAVPQKLRISSGVAEGNLVNRVEPTYPAMAKIAHVQGDVVLQALISKGGGIENLRAVSGHPILIQAAMDAVRQWRYKPYLLNGEPVEVETTITVRFHM